MAAFKDPSSRTWSRGRPGRRPLFLVLVSLICLTGFYACSRRPLERANIERLNVVSRAPISGRAWVVDGDTIRIGRVSIRLQGLDAPEQDQSCVGADGKSWPCGQVATRQLREHIRGRSVTCRPQAIDRYRRVVATCSLPDGSELNAWLVRQGWAVAYGFSRGYVSEETEAKAEKRGIWAGSFMPPAEWRRLKGNGSRWRWHPWER